MTKKNKWFIYSFFIWALSIFITGWSCSGQKDIQPNPSWKSEILELRKQKDLEFKTSPTSPMAAVKRLTAEAGSDVYVNEKSSDISLTDSLSPESKLMIRGEEGKWFWEPVVEEVTCTSKEKVLTSGSTLPGYAEFHLGKLLLAAYPKEKELTLIVFNPERTEILHFKHLVYFPPDPIFALNAFKEILPSPAPIKMLTSQNLEKTLYKYAKIRFELQGKKVELTAYKYSLQGPDSNILFIPFYDTTTGEETYGAGRFLEFPEMEEKTFTLDFNRCFNPLCNYSPAYNCPIPPEENHLPVAIYAGEKTYPH